MRLILLHRRRAVSPGVPSNCLGGLYCAALPYDTYHKDTTTIAPFAHSVPLFGRRNIIDQWSGPIIMLQAHKLLMRPQALTANTAGSKVRCFTEFQGRA